MNITDVRIRKVETDNRMKAIASITLDDCFVIHDLRVIPRGRTLIRGNAKS